MITDTHRPFAVSLADRRQITGHELHWNRDVQDCAHPQAIRLHQGNELTSRDMGLWTYQKDAIACVPRLDEPSNIASIQSFDSKVLAKRLNAH